jgi:hypothetical protein
MTRPAGRPGRSALRPTGGEGRTIVPGTNHTWDAHAAPGRKRAGKLAGEEGGT